MYAPNMNEDGEIVEEPTTPEDFRKMAEEWGLDPSELDDLE